MIRNDKTAIVKALYVLCQDCSDSVLHGTNSLLHTDTIVFHSLPRLCQQGHSGLRHSQRPSTGHNTGSWESQHQPLWNEPSAPETRRSYGTQSSQLSTLCSISQYPACCTWERGINYVPCVWNKLGKERWVILVVFSLNHKLKWELHSLNMYFTHSWMKTVAGARKTERRSTSPSWLILIQQ